MFFETQGSQTFSRDIPGFYRDIPPGRGRPKSLRKKGLCSILVPYSWDISDPHAGISLTLALGCSGQKLANPSALYRGQKPQNREKRVSESKNPHFSPPQKWVLRVKKSPFLYRAPQGKWGFFDSKRPFLGWGEMGVFRLRNPLFLILGGFWPLYRADGFANKNSVQGAFFCRVHAKGVVLCERTCFCLLSTF